MKEAPGSSETSVLTKPHGVTTQKTPFLKGEMFVNIRPDILKLFV
jgi:hypothetical protein